MAETWDFERLKEEVAKAWDSEPGRVMVLDLMKRWLERGDGVAVYENADFESPEMGQRQYLSFGSSLAQIEVDEPPQRMPDIGTSINWRYQLIATVRGT